MAYYAKVNSQNIAEQIIVATPEVISTYAESWGGFIDEVIVEGVAWSSNKVKKYYTYSKGRFGIV